MERRRGGRYAVAAAGALQERANMSRTVVVGASSGLGRCIGIGLAQRGGQIALLARRRARIEAAAEEAGSGAVAIECDVTDEGSCRSAFDQAAEALGGIDNLIYTPADQPARPHGRHRRRHVAAHLRHQRHRRVAGDGGGDSAPDGLRGQSGLPLLGRGHLRAALARPRRLRRQQGRAGTTRGGLAGRAPGRRLHLPHRRGVRGRRGRRGNRDERRLGHGSGDEGLPAVGVGRLHARQVDAGRRPHRGGADDSADQCLDVDAGRGCQGAPAGPVAFPDTN